MSTPSQRLSPDIVTVLWDFWGSSEPEQPQSLSPVRLAACSVELPQPPVFPKSPICAVNLDIPEPQLIPEPEDAILPEVVGFCGHPWQSVKPLMGTHCCGWLPSRPRGFSFYPCCHPSLSNPCDGLHWPPLTSPKGPSLSHIRVSVAIVGLCPRHPRVYITLVGFHPSHLLAMPPKVSSVSALASSQSYPLPSVASCQATGWTMSPLVLASRVSSCLSPVVTTGGHLFCHHGSLV